MENLYYIQSLKRGFLGNSALWWAPFSQGYTADLNQAGKYTEKEARGICTHLLSKNKAWPCSYIDGKPEGIERHLNDDRADKSKIKVWK